MLETFIHDIFMLFHPKRKNYNVITHTGVSLYQRH